MKRVVASLAVLGCAWSCASDKTARKAPPPAGDPFADALRGGPPKGYVPGRGPGGGGEGPSGFKMEQEVGTLDQEEVEDALQSRFNAIVRCYDRAGEAQKYAAGRVRLRFVVNAQGVVDDVLVLESRLGSFQVERCVVDEARRARLPRPGGGVGTTFDWKVDFRSTQEKVVVDWPAARIEAELAAQAADLAPCGKLGPEPVSATFYILPRGTGIGSIGLASEGRLDGAAATCAVEKMRAWRLPSEDHGAVARVVALVPDPAEAPPAAAKPDPPGRGGRKGRATKGLH